MSPHIRRLAAIASAAVLLVVSCGDGRSDMAEGTDPDAPADARAVRFETGDGLKLSGYVFGTGPRGVVLAHMFPSNASSWYPMARRLGESGWSALAFNFRGYGASEGDRDPAQAEEDLRSAYEFVRRTGVEVVALVGASMGGTASIMLAAAVQPPAVVAISPSTSFRGLDAATAAPRVEAPTLLLASRDDEPAAESLRQLASLMPNAEPKLFEGSAHGTNLLSDRIESEEEVLAFLSEHAPPVPREPAAAA